MPLPDLIPVEELLGNPERALAQISPDGTRLSYVAPVNDVLNVWVGAIGAEDHKPVTKDTDRGIRGYRWAYDNRHILYVQDVGGDENWHVYATDLETGETRDLTPFEGVQAGLVAANKDHPGTVIVKLNKDDARLHDAYRLDILTGELTKVAANPGAVLVWTADRDLRVRGAMSMRADGGSELLVRDTEEAEWRTLATWSADDGLAVGPVGFSKDGRSIFALDPRGANAAQLVRLDLATGEASRVAGDDRYDVSDMMSDPNSYEPRAVSFARAMVEWEVLDDAIREDFDRIASVQRGEFSVGGTDVSDRIWLVSFDTDDGPVSYYAYDRDSKEATFLFHSRPQLAKYTLAQMEPVSFPARDGLLLEGYLTLPPGVEPAGLPMILDVHGGPWARDAWGFNPEVQWMANRGYAVLQVNFRGSTGYGKAHLNAGDREWAGKMHDDLLDAVAWAVARGVADPARVAIYGGSYGGYAALVGATFTPDVFRCAVDIVGPSSIKTLIESIPPYWAPMIALFNERVGNPETDEDFMWSRSPLSKVDAITIPLLIAQGRNDPRVKVSESLQIVEAMKAKGIDHTYLEYADEGHGFAKPENRIHFYREAERFLAKHMGGRAAD